MYLISIYFVDVQAYSDVGFKGFLISVIVALAIYIREIHKDKKETQKDFDARLERKEAKIDKIIEDTNNDFKKIIEDGVKERIDMRFFLDKNNEVLSEVKRILHDRNGG